MPLCHLKGVADLAAKGGEAMIVTNACKALKNWPKRPATPVRIVAPDMSAVSVTGAVRSKNQPCFGRQLRV